MNSYHNIEEATLSEIYGGNPAGDATIAAMTCAAGAVKLAGRFGPWVALAGGVGVAVVCGYLAYSARS